MTELVASLGMYDRRELRAANDALWAVIARRLRSAGIANVPGKLERKRPLHDIWSDPDLLLAQCCGYPMTKAFDGRLRYVATLSYRAAGCEGAHHRSRFIVRRDDPRETLADYAGSRAVINQWDSNTGMNLMRDAVARLSAGSQFFSNVVESGSHGRSAELIAAGEADIAAIDTVTFAHLERYDQDVTRQLRTLGWTDLTPGLPLVTSLKRNAHELASLRHALRMALRDPAIAAARFTLLIGGMRQLYPRSYGSIDHIEQRAKRAGYPVLC